MYFRSWRSIVAASMVTAALLASPHLAVAQAVRFDVLHTFPPMGPINPYGALVRASDGNFYGMTYAGGSANVGTVFRMTPAGAITILHLFLDTEGPPLYGALIQATDGNLYGTT